MGTKGIRVARPYLVRAGAAGSVALAGLVAASLFGQIRDLRVSGIVTDRATGSEQVIALCGVAVLVLAGIVMVRALAAAIRAAAEASDAEARGASLAFLTSLAGYFVIFVTGLGLLGVDLRGLLVGGALTGVVIGIAAQQTIGNFFAGIVLLAARPFTIGESIVLRSGALGGEYIGRVEDMSLFYVHLVTDAGPVLLPNSGVLAAAIGPGARKPDDPPPPDVVGPPA